MHLSILVVCQRILLQPFGHHFIGDDNSLFRFRLHNEFQYIKQLAGIPTGEAQHSCGFFQFNLTFFQYRVCTNGTFQKFQQIFFLQRFQHIKLAAGQERTNHFERRVLRGGTDECHRTVFHCSQQRVLLRLAKPMNFIDKQNRAGLGEKSVALGTVYHFADIFHAGSHCT